MSDTHQLSMDLGLAEPTAEKAKTGRKPEVQTKLKTEAQPKTAVHAAPRRGETARSQMEDAHVLVPDEFRKDLRANWRRGIDVLPVLKIFSPVGAATWLIHSQEPREPDILFGLCDLGMGFPELGSVSLEELQELRVPMRLVINGQREITTGMKLERDLYFRPKHNLEVYVEAAQSAQGITENPEALAKAAQYCGRPGARRRR